MASLSRPVAITKVDNKIKEENEHPCRQQAESNQNSRYYSACIGEPIDVNVNQNTDEWQK